MANLRTFTVLVHAAEPDETGFWAEVVELPGCFASGDTLDDLESDVRDAIETYLLALTARGEPIPGGSDRVQDESMRRWEIPVEVA
ncbi:MAG TPA: type II toxin-antitoxin system HicB family antitoxin [Dehalococcoidia bacterium]|nr:type II toxin-antitoxin system HicB family antitoxin [Dehalococcoidia bacterium]